MTIAQSDVRLFASLRMTDYSDGGGPMSSVVVTDGGKNNVFPDVADLDRVTGRTSLRKVYGAVTSANADPYLSAHALLDDAPDDAATSAVVFAFGNLASTRADALAALAGAALPQLAVYSQSTPVLLAGYSCTASWTGGGTDLTLARSFLNDATWGNFGTGPAVDAGDFIAVTQSGVTTLYSPAAAVASTVALAGSRTWMISIVGALPGSGAQLGTVQFLSAAAAQRCYGVSVSSAGAASGASSIAVASRLARVVPVDLTVAYPSTYSASWGIDSATWSALAGSQGQVPIILKGDAVLIHSAIAMSPATVSNGQTVSTGRTTLSRLRVIGNNGVEIARFSAGLPAPSGVGCTADLTAGTVTFSNVAGMSQPVTVEHRIEEMAQVSGTPGNTLALNRPLSRAYPAGTAVSSLVMLGDLQARVQGSFSQTAWTGAWSNAVAGSAPSANFDAADYPIAVTNAGAVTERWYALFTGPTTFRMIGESLGELPGGNTGAPYAPVNPATGAPYMTIPLLGWGSGWAAGNVYRFNTTGANAPLWALRCVAPSVPGSSDSATVEFRGYINS